MKECVPSAEQTPMTKQALIERTVKALGQLPVEKLQEVSDFTDFVLKQYEEFLLTHAAQKLTEQGQAFEFLKDEEDLYSEEDLKEVYHGQG